MNKKKVYSLVGAWIILIHLPARAVLMGYSKPLSQTIEQSKLIVVARLIKYTPDPAKEFSSKPTKGLDGQEAYVGEDALYKFFTEKAPGHYSLQVAQTVSGETPATLEIDLPYILQNYYGGIRFKLEEGDLALFMLKLNTQGQWEPVDKLLPLIPLGNNAPISATVADKPPLERVIALLLASLDDPLLRKINTYLLRNVTDPEVVAGLAPYLNDPTLTVQDNVLYAMAENQQVIVIPRISALTETMRKTGRYPQAAKALRDFIAPEAVPYLNPLLFHSDRYVRFQAGLSLGQIGDHTSIPYLLLAMRDPQPGEGLAHTSYLCLLRLLNMWNVAKNATDFWPHREQEMQPIYAWWRDELSGKHTPPQPGLAPPAPKPMPELAKLTQEQALPSLNPLLFETTLSTRQQAMAALVKLADQSSIPYLLVALYDPDNTVAYGAYKTLHRLLSDVGPAQPRPKFEAQKEAEVKSLYDWWQEELGGLHTTDTIALVSLAHGDTAFAYKAYQRLHQLDPVLGVAKSEQDFYAHRKEEIATIEQWRTAEWKKAHPQPPIIPVITPPNKVRQNVP